jgi:hypothetical protein
MALPYVTFFITDDKKFRAQAARISEGITFPVATILTKAEFDAQHPGLRI